ncbi:MAG: Uma2 family endonuclease [Chloroflexi bacterium]|nr:Uma2 family endonuclease [Chloroflexota bacterium]
MSISARFTSTDLERLPAVEGIRYEIVDGDLFVSKQPHWHHQYASDGIVSTLRDWDDRTGLGIAMSAPGLVFTEDNDVIPDVVWISRARLAAVADAAGHLRAAPELVVEVLSPGRENERRDREVKLALYARQGVREYWIVDLQRQAVEVYRQIEDGPSTGSGQALRLVATLAGEDVLTTPLLPGFTCPVLRLWVP